MNTVKAYAPGDTERELTLTRVFDAPRALVFRAWTDPKLLARWWGPQMFTNPVCEVDARPGGHLRIVMRGPDGSDYPMRGVFREVVAPEKLSFTNFAVDLEDRPVIEGFTTVLFAEEGGKTRLTIHTCGKAVQPVAVQYLQGMEQGWTGSLEKLATLLPQL
ncbi:MAG: SRPBCC family protein [Bacillota bacterium]